MDYKKAIELLENGEAKLVVAQALILSVDGTVWISFDGIDWEETGIEIVLNNIQK